MENKYFSTLTVENLKFVYILAPSKDKNMENKKDQTMMSLFDYLGKAAGRELGVAVHKVAMQFSVNVEIKTVATKTYSGEIKMYPKYFLDFYFINFQPWEKRMTKVASEEEITLPF